MRALDVLGRLSTTAVAAAAMAIGTFTAGATPASAAAPATVTGVCNPGCSANATFDSYGEKFTVHDYAPDHHATVGYLYTWNGSAWVLHGSVLNRNGYNGSPVTANYSIAEGTNVAYAACLYESSGPFQCSKFYYTKA